MLAAQLKRYPAGRRDGMSFHGCGLAKLIADSSPRPPDRTIRGSPY